jgi:hypothetical protein
MTLSFMGSSVSRFVSVRASFGGGITGLKGHGLDPLATRGCLHAARWSHRYGDLNARAVGQSRDAPPCPVTEASRLLALLAATPMLMTRMTRAVFIICSFGSASSQAF